MANTPVSALRTAEASASSGSLVTTESGASPLNLPSGTLRLRAEPVQRRHIQWAEDVVDNEGMGKKSSKVCCIYHKQREFGESSDESSSDDDSSSDDNSDSEPDNSTARPPNSGRGRPHNHRGHSSGGPKKARKRSPNAYEKMPNYTKKNGGSDN
ncbi:putative type 1 phosphatase regulator ypi1 protein [Neofusicoccum parvum UCRNP2]|uniref:Type 1 phosphatases regulator n=1 Tax=Botryosphaeria parva (strain UCR-NP2) TaxID=1287680 RepID=R1GES7_BOTPV|nr:putative type 1 phosphatase regulator ypi1 protein [Neofusicoccum parvum UCRNP2]